MSDFEKILKALEKGEHFKLSKYNDGGTYDKWEFEDRKEITLYPTDEFTCEYDINFDFDKDGNLIEIY